MTTVRLKRFFTDEKQTLGSLSFLNESEVFTCKALELGWDKNINNKSCIPNGNYSCRWTRSNRLSAAAGHDVFTYEVINVPSRAGIRIHAANYYNQLLGCIALGDAHKDLNADGELDLIHSGDTIKNFNAIMNGREFMLVIE
jgi:hypothetical protein